MKTPNDIKSWVDMLLERKPNVEDRNYLEAIKFYIERPQGEWIDTGHMEEYWEEEYQCSICGAKDHWHKFCPNCGVEMKGD